MNTKKTGDYIAKRRKSLNLSQQELADLLDVSNKTVSKWETGTGFPDISILPALAEQLHTTTDNLLYGEEKTPTHAETPQSTTANNEVTSFLIDKQTTYFRIRTMAALLAAVIGYIIFFAVLWEDTLHMALLVGTCFEIISFGMFFCFLFYL